MAKGTYKPDEGTLPNGFPITKGDVDQKFTFGNQKIYGGFSGNENSLQERDYINNITLITGSDGNENGTALLLRETYLDGCTVTARMGIIGFRDFGLANCTIRDCHTGVSGEVRTIYNCLFENNRNALEPKSRGLFLYNCIFLNSINAYMDPSGYVSVLDAYQNIFFSGKIHTAHTFYSSLFVNCRGFWRTFSASSYTIPNTVNSLWLEDFDINQQVYFVNPSNPLGIDGIAGTLDDGLRPKANSPAIDSGVNTHVKVDLLDPSKGYLDLSGQSRVVGNSVDLGPYEYDPQIDGSQNSSENSSGSSERKPVEEFTPTGWSYWAKHPWYYNNGEWYYMKALGSSIFLYKYSSKEWHSLPE